MKINDILITKDRMETIIHGVTWEVPIGSVLIVTGLRKNGKVRVQWDTALGTLQWIITESVLQNHTQNRMETVKS